MENITKALQDLAKAVENNKTVQNVKVTITLKKPKPNKADQNSKQLLVGKEGERFATLCAYCNITFKRSQ